MLNKNKVFKKDEEKCSPISKELSRPLIEHSNRISPAKTQNNSAMKEFEKKKLLL